MTTAYRQEAGTIPEWTLGWRLLRALSHAGMTMQEMADELGVARTTISRWTNDQGAAPRRAFMRQWSLITGVPLAWLEHGDDLGTSGAEPDHQAAEVTRINRGLYGLPARRVVASLGRAA